MFTSIRVFALLKASLSVTTYSAHKGMQFAISCQMGGREYWDNNNGANYSVRTAYG